MRYCPCCHHCSVDPPCADVPIDYGQHKAPCNRCTNEAEIRAAYTATDLGDGSWSVRWPGGGADVHGCATQEDAIARTVGHFVGGAT